MIYRPIYVYIWTEIMSIFTSNWIVLFCVSFLFANLVCFRKRISFINGLFVYLWGLFHLLYMCLCTDINYFYNVPYYINDQMYATPSPLYYTITHMLHHYKYEIPLQECYIQECNNTITRELCNRKNTIDITRMLYHHKNTIQS